MNVIINSPPKLLSTNSQEITTKVIPKVKTQGRARDIYKYIDGKNIIVARDLETDVLDFVSNLCINMIESKKIRKIINSPKTITVLYESKNDFEKAFNYVNSLLPIKLKHEDKSMLNTMFGNNFAQVLIDLMLHYQDYSLSITKI